MLLCTSCHKNIAVVFVTKIINGKQIQEGLCLSCAKKQGIQPINQIIEQTGMTDEDIENLNSQMSSFLENIDMDKWTEDNLGNQAGDGNMFSGFFNKAFPKNQKDEDGFVDNKRRDKADDKEQKNTMRTKTQER